MKLDLLIPNIASSFGALNHCPSLFMGCIFYQSRYTYLISESTLKFIFPNAPLFTKKSTIHVLLQNMCVYVCCCVHVCTLTNPIYLCWQSALLIFSSYVQFFQSNTIMDQFLLYICRVLFFLHCKESHCTFCLLMSKNYRYGDLRVSLYIPFLYTHLICHTSFVQQVSSYIPFFIYTFDLPHFVCTPRFLPFITCLNTATATEH
jgi:hypothetical protein